MIDSSGKITLYVNNQNEARDFWTEKMGFIVRLEQQMGADQKWLEVGPEYGGGTSFVLYDKEKMKTQNPDVNVGHPSIILCTGDLENAHREMKERGVRTGDIMKMPYGSMFQFYDMDGNVFLLREEARVH